jgi:hypothetical protein
MAPAATSTAPAVVKVGNTKCIVSGEDKMGEGSTITYNGKEYNLCCPMCKKDFNKDPEKYVKALEANPDKFGVPKKEAAK